MPRSSSATKLSVWPTKSTAKLRTFSPCAASCRAASAVMAEESSPPESRVQRGTSATSWRRTMSSRSERTVAMVVSRSSVCGRVSRRQYDAGGQAGAVDGDDRAGLHLAHAVPEGVARRLDHDEQLAQAVQRDAGPDQRVGEDRLGFGAEEDAVGGGLVVERLDAHAVADHDQLVVAAVPHGERVHAVEPFGDGVAPLQVAVQHDLGVGVGGEPVAAVREFPAQLGEVVGLPGVDEGDGSLGGRQGHRLTAARQVDDGEPAVSQGGGALGPGAAVVRAPAGHRLGHRMQSGGLGREVTVEGDPSGDAAHALPPASGCPSVPRSPALSRSRGNRPANQLYRAPT
ncbi:hypothetical protein SCANM63S_02689 [Streptomyces canarius]